MKILYICGDDPSLTGCGTQQRTHFLYEALKKIGDVTVRVPSKNRKWTAAERIFVGLTKEGEWPFKSERRVRKELGIGDEKYDIVVTRYLRNAGRFAAWKIAPLVVDVDDVPMQAFLNVDICRIPIVLRPLSKILLSVWQKYVLSKCHAVFVCKMDDVQALPSNIARGILPNLAKNPSVTYKVCGKQTKRLLTVGYMAYSPNCQGVNWFIDNIWRRFHNQYPEWEYIIAGGGASQENMDRWNSTLGVKALGFVDDLDCLYANAYAVVAPIKSGAGTCIKVVESALHGRKTFTTRMAARGFTDVDILNLGLTVFENYSEFVHTLNEWESKTKEELLTKQLDIKSQAERYNSFERFSELVHHLIDRILKGGEL